MMKRTFMFGLCITAFVALFGCKAESSSESDNTKMQETPIDIEMKTAEEQVDMLENYTYEDYKKVFDKVVREAESFSLENEELKKWVIRTLTQEKLYFETDLTQEETLQLAELDMKKDQEWKELASEEYGITITEEEIENHLDEFAPALENGSSEDQLQAYADTLGLTIRELLYEYDRDYAVKMVIGDKLIPILKEKYDTSEHNVLVEKYMNEVESKLGFSEAAQENNE